MMYSVLAFSCNELLDTQITHTVKDADAKINTYMYLYTCVFKGGNTAREILRRRRRRRRRGVARVSFRSSRYRKTCEKDYVLMCMA